jgi:hypothetical protein
VVVDQHEPVASPQLVEDTEECFVSPLWFQVVNVDRSENIVPTVGAEMGIR